MANEEKKPETFSEWFSRHPCREGRCEVGKKIKPEEWVHSRCFKTPCPAHLKWDDERPGKGVSIFSQES
jgi:hypothetical protein